MYFNCGLETVTVDGSYVLRLSVTKVKFVTRINENSNHPPTNLATLEACGLKMISIELASEIHKEYGMIDLIFVMAGMMPFVKNLFS